MSKQPTHFVNGARNQVFLSGIVRHISKGESLLLQGSKVDRGIPLRFTGNTKRPSDGELVEVTGHIRGYREEDSRRSRAYVEAFYCKRASLGAAPKRYAMAGKIQLDEGRPMIAFDEIKASLAQQMRLDEKVIDRILSSDKRSDGQFLNKVFISGFVGFKAFVPGSLEHDTDPYVAFNLLQNQEEEKAVPVHVMRANAEFGKLISRMAPLNIVGSIGMDLTRDEEGAVTGRSLFIRADRHTVSTALAKDFEGKRYPDWWREMVVAEIKRRDADAEASRQANAEKVDAKPKREAPAEEMAPAEALPAAKVGRGVTVTDLEV